MNPIRPYSPQPSGPPLAAVRGMRGRLFRSHLIVAGIGVMMLGVTLAVAVWARRHTERLTALRSPTMKNALRAKAGLQRSLAALRGWIIVRDPDFRTERAETWKRDIEPAVTELRTLSGEWTNPDNVQRLQELRQVLRELKEAQWWIEDVAQSAGNTPARVRQTQDVDPPADNIELSIAATIEIEKEQAGSPQRRPLLVLLADLQSAFSRSRSALNRFEDRGIEADRTEYVRWTNEARRTIDKLKTHTTRLTDEQRELLPVIDDEFRAYATFSGQAVALRKQDDWNIARHRLKSDAVPKARRATALLTAMTANQAELMDADAALVARTSDAAILLSLVLIVGLMFTTFVLARQNADRIVEPVDRLVNATWEFTAGNLQCDIPVTSDDELGLLTSLFNSMRRALQEASIELRHQADELRHSEARMRGILESAADAIITINERGMIVSFNPAAEDLFGYSANEAIGRNVNILMPPPFSEKHDDYLANYLTTGEKRIIGVGREAVGLKSDGTEFPLELAVSEVEHGVTKLFTGIVRDITERKAAEEDLNTAIESARAANVAKSEFLANMSHEIRTPMTAILGYTDVLLEELSLTNAPRERLESLRTIQRNGHHLLELINDILDLSKIEAGKLLVEASAASSQAVLDDVRALMRVRADEKNIAFEVNYETPIPARIQTDATRLRQILVNLTGNAIKFTAAGRVAINVRFLDGETPRMEFDIVDTGIGLTPEQQKRLFQPFTQADASTTRNFGGTGLGLTISKRLAGLLGGDVTIAESAADVGTTFRLTVNTGSVAGVPMIEPEQSAPREQLEVPHAIVPAPDSKALEGVRILLAEDGRDNQRLITFLLNKDGAEVELAENGQLAVEAALRASEHEQLFDVILMDMQMPVVDGYTATARLRADGYRGRIIALTANAMLGDRQKCLDAGCDDYATKPINRPALRATILRVLNEESDESPRHDEHAVLAQIEHDISTLQQSMRSFLQRSDSLVAEMQRSVENRDAASLVRAAKTLKQSTAGLQAVAVTQTAFTLERIGAEDRIEDAAAALARLEAALESLRGKSS